MNKLNDVIEREELLCDRKTLQEINDLLKINNKERLVMEYIVTYQINKENNLWKTTKFEDRKKAEEYYNKMLNHWNKAYFSTIDEATIKKNNKSNILLMWCNKKYKINYFEEQQYYNNKIKTVEGKLISYDSPFTGRFFLERDNGALEIIPMTSVVEMREIVE